MDLTLFALTFLRQLIDVLGSHCASTDSILRVHDMTNIRAYSLVLVYKYLYIL